MNRENLDRLNARRRRDGKFGARPHPEVEVELDAGRREFRDLNAGLSHWDQSLSSGQIGTDELEMLGNDKMRDMVMGLCSSDDEENHQRVLSGMEASRALMPGTCALMTGKMANWQDATWLQDAGIGKGVEPGRRLEALIASTEDREGLSEPAAANAAVLNSWAKIVSGDTAGARGTIAQARQEHPENRMLPMLDMLATRRTRDR